MTKIHIALINTALLLTGVLIGCGGDEGTTIKRRGQARPAVNRRKAGKRKSAAPVLHNEMVDHKIYKYRAGRDPFEPFFFVAKKIGIEQFNPIHPLQKYGLEQIQVLGIVSQTIRARAIVRDPKGRFYIVKRGDLIGPPHGEVVQIRTDRLIVERKVKDRSDKVHRVVTSLMLRKEQNR